MTTERILITNDDGIGADGLKALEKIAKALAREVWIVAPEHEQSGAGHSLTLRRPLRIRRLGTRRFAVDGTPTDCVLLAVKEIMKGKRPDLILSGVNHGGNMGEDVTYSGTVAAAMEGTLLEVPSLALSLALSGDQKPHWGTCVALMPSLIERLVARSWPANTLLNVNIPNLAADAVRGVRASAQGRRKIGGGITAGRDPKGRPYYWIGSTRDEDSTVPGSDLNAVAAGLISVTPIRLDFTDGATLGDLREALP